MFEENENDINQNLNTEFYKKLNQQIVQKDKLIKMLQKHIEKLKDGMSIESNDEDHSDLLNQIENLKRENEDLNRVIEKFEENSSPVEEDIRKIEFLNNQLAEKDNEINAFIEKVEKLEFKINQQGNELMELQNQLSGSDSIKELKDTLEEDAKELQSRIEMMEVELGNRDRKIKELSEENSELSSSLNDSSDEEIISKYEVQIKSLETELDTIRSETQLELESLKQELETTGNQLNESIKNKTDVDASSTSIVKELEEKSLELEGLREKNKKLSEEYSILQQAVEDQIQGKDSVADVEKLESTVSDEVEELILKLNDLEKELVGEKELILRLQKEKEDLSLQIDKMKVITSNSDDKDDKSKLFEELSVALKLKDDLEMVNKSLEEKLKIAVEASPEYEISTNQIDNLKPVIEFYEKRSKEWDQKDKDFATVIFKEFGFSVVETVGVEYNPAFHELAGSVRSEKFPEGVVLNEVGQGYIFRDLVLKKAKVTIVKNSVECSSCLKPVKSDDKFCSGCGARVDMILTSIGEEEELEKAALIFYKIARSYFHGGDYSGALLRLEESLKIDSDNENSIRLKGDVYEKLGNFEKSLECFQKVYDINPDVKNENKLKGLRAKLTILNSIKDLEL
ncbi:tetratricopeptide repeat protein [bacterium]|nr:tetratricopeptide repeat protein [bacterium]